MKRERGSDDERGFTLVELLVAITILGIIMVAIGAMITTAFRTTTIVSNRLNASRAPKLVATYWGPDVAGAGQVNLGAGGCGDSAGGTPLATFTWTKFPSVVATDAPDPDAAGVDASTTWAVVTRGVRTQVVRRTCDGTSIRTATVVPDVAAGDVAVTQPETGLYRITVAVPDRNNVDKKFHFDVDGEQVAPEAGP